LVGACVASFWWSSFASTFLPAIEFVDGVSRPAGSHPAQPGPSSGPPLQQPGPLQQERRKPISRRGWMFGTLYVPAKAREHLNFGVEPDGRNRQTITNACPSSFARATQTASAVPDDGRARRPIRLSRGRFHHPKAMVPGGAGAVSGYGCARFGRGSQTLETSPEKRPRRAAICMLRMCSISRHMVGRRGAARRDRRSTFGHHCENLAARAVRNIKAGSMSGEQ